MHGAYVLGTCLPNEKQFAIDTLGFGDEQLLAIGPELSNEEMVRPLGEAGVDISSSILPSVVSRERIRSKIVDNMCCAR